MKMTTRLVVIFLALLSTTTTKAQDDPSDTIKGTIRAMYRELAQGDFDAALGERVMIGVTGYLREGLLREAPDAETLAMVVAQYKAAYEDGMRIMLMPSHINVMGNSRGALATFLLEGTVTEPGSGETIRVLDRASHLLLNVEGKWKLAHFHLSKLTLPDEDGDEEEEDEEDHEDDDEEDNDNDDDDDDDDDEDDNDD